MPATFTLISSVTVGSGGAANIEFTSIPATYTDLLIKISARNTSSGDWLGVSFNGSTSNFNSRRIFGYVGGVLSLNNANGLDVISNNNSGDTANTFDNAEMYISNYASSNNKSFSADSVAENNTSSAYLTLTAGLWSQSAAITSITLTPNTNNLAQYSTAYLYGISSS